MAPSEFSLELNDEQVQVLATGVTATLTKYDATIDAATVSARGTNRRFARPANSSTGSSTAIVVSVEARTGSTTTFVPCSAASYEDRPRFR